MNLNISYDSNTQANAPAAFFSAVNYVATLFDNTFTTNATVNIELGYGNFPLNNSLVSPLGESEQSSVQTVGYTQARQQLMAQGAPGAGTLPATAPISGNLVMGTAQE